MGAISRRPEGRASGAGPLRATSALAVRVLAVRVLAVRVLAARVLAARVLAVTVLGVVLPGLACGGRPSGQGAGARPVPRRLPLERVLVLGTSGPPPSDTSVVFTAGERRIIILRHGPPENVVFAELQFPAESFAADSGREVRVEVRPRRGVYGLELRANAIIGRGAAVVFKYPRYFAAPAAARLTYPTDLRYERALAVGRVVQGDTIAFLPSTRPAADNLEAPIRASGTYLVAAPR